MTVMQSAQASLRETERRLAEATAERDGFAAQVRALTDQLIRQDAERDALARLVVKLSTEEA
jgi:hypothetical protein